MKRIGYNEVVKLIKLKGVENAICGGAIRRKGGRFFLNDEEWDGRAKVVCGDVD